MNLVGHYQKRLYQLLASLTQTHIYAHTHTGPCKNTHTHLAHTHDKENDSHSNHLTILIDKRLSIKQKVQQNRDLRNLGIDVKTESLNQHTLM